MDAAAHEYYRRRQKERRARAKALTQGYHIRGVQGVGRAKLAHMETPPDVLAEAVRAFGSPRTLTAIIMGDPLPGRSALDHEAMK